MDAYNIHNNIYVKTVWLAAIQRTNDLSLIISDIWFSMNTILMMTLYFLYQHLIYSIDINNL